MPTAQRSNYDAIERGLATLMQQKWVGMPVEIGDYSKIQTETPCAVVAHGELRSPLEDRFPQFERLHWVIPVHIFFDYTSDVEAHALFRLFRADFVQLMAQHRYIDDGNTPYPAGQQGQAEDSKIIHSMPPQYITIDGRDFVQSTYLVWISERVVVTYP